MVATLCKCIRDITREPTHSSSPGAGRGAGPGGSRGGSSSPSSDGGSGTGAPPLALRGVAQRRVRPRALVGLAPRGDGRCALLHLRRLRRGLGGRRAHGVGLGLRRRRLVDGFWLRRDGLVDGLRLLGLRRGGLGAVAGLRPVRFRWFRRLGRGGGLGSSSSSRFRLGHRGGLGARRLLRRRLLGSESLGFDALGLEAFSFQPLSLQALELGLLGGETLRFQPLRF